MNFIKKIKKKINEKNNLQLIIPSRDVNIPRAADAYIVYSVYYGARIYLQYKGNCAVLKVCVWDFFEALAAKSQLH